MLDWLLQYTCFWAIEEIIKFSLLFLLKEGKELSSRIEENIRKAEESNNLEP